MSEMVSDALVFFDATGDLAYKKSLRALQAMVKRGHLNAIEMDGYEHVLSDAMEGDRAFFAREDYLCVIEHKPGAWGPKEVNDEVSQKRTNHVLPKPDNSFAIDSHRGCQVSTLSQAKCAALPRRFTSVSGACLQSSPRSRPWSSGRPTHRKASARTRAIQRWNEIRGTVRVEWLFRCSIPPKTGPRRRSVRGA